LTAQTGVAARVDSEELGVAGSAVAGRGARPRLLILTEGYEAGDVGELIGMVAPRLQREGFEVIVACLGAWGPLGEELEGRGTRAVALGTARPWDLRGAGRLLSLLRRERIQIVHAHLFSAGLVARILGRIADVPVIITSQHDTDLAMGLGRRLAERITAPLCDTVVASSESVRRFAVETYGLRPGLVRTLRVAVEIPGEPEDERRRETVRRELGAGPQDLLVGAIGALQEPKRGLSVFLAAARLLAHELPRVRFALVGNGPARLRLEERAAEEGVSHRTTFSGARRDVTEVLRALDLFVEPALWEGLGLTLLRATAAGRPVVATRVGALPELVLDGRTGILVPPGDPPALAAACASLLRDGARAGRLAAAARQRAATSFRIELLVQDTADLYRGCLARARLASERSGAAARRGA